MKGSLRSKWSVFILYYFLHAPTSAVKVTFSQVIVFGVRLFYFIAQIFIAARSTIVYQ